jgi:imidazole glycerol phosphate synthase glutamine amidotransferase subunit
VKFTLIDYGAGNLPSVERALHRLGAESDRAITPEAIRSAAALILPGVGHYAAFVAALDKRNLREPILESIQRGVPFLGICLGLQALYDSSEEAPELDGLHLLQGVVRSLPHKVKLPHMGWNTLRRTNSSVLLNGIADEAYFYFAHSFAVSTADPSIVACCSHGQEFAAVVEKKNIFAVQFHPEKSGQAGARVLQNFLRLAA